MLKTAVDLLEKNLDFTYVKVFKDFSKSQVIEKLDLIQCEVDDFEQEKNKPEDFQVVAIFNIGYIIPWMTRELQNGPRGDEKEV